MVEPESQTPEFGDSDENRTLPNQLLLSQARPQQGLELPSLQPSPWDSRTPGDVLPGAWYSRGVREAEESHVKTMLYGNAQQMEQIAQVLAKALRD